MTTDAPPFWWQPPGLRAALLAPAAWLYGSLAGWKLEHAVPPQIDVPVICVGNFTVGGSGKTPIAIALARHSRELGYTPGFLIRGYGGRLAAAKLVDRDQDSARLVGDEALLLAGHGPVAAGVDRLAAAQILRDNGCDMLIMDDGFQSRRLACDFALMVVDASRGIGNGKVIPAGPLRAPLVSQLRQADALLVVGSGQAGGPVIRMAARAGKPISEAQIVPRDPVSVADRRFLAFAGIGNPEKFFSSLVEAGGWIAATREFPDHHPFSHAELDELQRTAKTMNAELITTEKDASRLRDGSSHARAFLEDLSVLTIDIRFEEKNVPAEIIRQAAERYSIRSLR